MAASLLTVALFLWASAVALLSSDNQWAKDHAFLIPWLWAAGSLALLFSILTSRWFKSVYLRFNGSEEPVREKPMTSQIRGRENQGAIAHGSTTAYAAGRDINLTQQRDELEVAAPQIVLGHSLATPGRGFYVISRGSSDAIGVRLIPVQSTNYTLTSDTIQHLQHDLTFKTALVVHIEHRDNGRRTHGEDASNEFALDMWTAEFPGPKSDPGDISSVAAMLSEVAGHMNTKQIVLGPIRVEYSDLRGRRFESSADVAWNPLGKTEEVRPGPVLPVNPPKQ